MASEGQPPPDEESPPVAFPVDATEGYVAPSPYGPGYEDNAVGDGDDGQAGGDDAGVNGVDVDAEVEEVEEHDGEEPDPETGDGGTKSRKSHFQQTFNEGADQALKFAGAFLSVGDSELHIKEEKEVWVVMEFPKKTVAKQRVRIAGLLAVAGLSYQFHKTGAGVWQLKVTCTNMEVMETQAQISCMQLLLKPKENDRVSHRYAQYTAARKSEFVEYENGSVFSPIDQIRLVQQIMRRQMGHVLEDKRTIARYFPMHDDVNCTSMKKRAIRVCKGKVPIADCRAYYGERVALYYAFLTFYWKWLCFPALFGVVCFALILGSQFQKTRVMAGYVEPVYCVSMIVWGTLFLVFLQRHYHSWAFKWNTYGYVDQSQPLAGFKGKERVNEVSMMPELYYAPWKRYIFKYPVTYTVVLSMVILVVAVVIANMVFKSTKILGVHTNWVSATCTGCCIFVLNKFYKKLAFWLNRMENHQTEGAFERAYILKTFMFQFFNSYGSLYYVAFFRGNLHLIGIPKEYDRACHFESCIDDLGVQLIFMFATQLLIGNMTDLIVPYCMHYLKVYYKRKGVKAKIDAFEDQASRNVHTTFDGYSEMIRQFGYVSLFAAALPLAPFLALLHNFIMIKGDFWRLSVLKQRPFPQYAGTLGTWKVCLDIMVYLSIFTNVALLAFLSRQRFYNPGWWIKLAYMFILEHIFFALKYVITLFIPKTTRDVKRQMDILDQEKALELLGQWVSPAQLNSQVQEEQVSMLEKADHEDSEREAERRFSDKRSENSSQSDLSSIQDPNSDLDDDAPLLDRQYSGPQKAGSAQKVKPKKQKTLFKLPLPSLGRWGTTKHSKGKKGKKARFADDEEGGEEGATDKKDD